MELQELLQWIAKELEKIDELDAEYMLDIMKGHIIRKRLRLMETEMDRHKGMRDFIKRIYKILEKKGIKIEYQNEFGF